ncbi:hypothetical protein Pmani_004872 [Petrolisthes manimaculis]|uniref:Ig-like domain-containing protein n=1 Tax=Petrolisthes manimaculis TaxID=1843537 RepID=A0AAE1QDU0_9EUCA|nr:hypothetical protein Pmani_004872 [Petrolisthes manimaculis]
MQGLRRRGRGKARIRATAEKAWRRRGREVVVEERGGVEKVGRKDGGGGGVVEEEEEERRGNVDNDGDDDGGRGTTTTTTEDVLDDDYAFFILGYSVVMTDAGAGLYPGPYFPSSQPRNITVHQDSNAYLPCTVMQLGDKSVSWVRHEDADILTVGRYTFVKDERLTVHHSPDTHTWTLVIKFVQERDAGTYECQVSTEPKMALLVHLNVIVPKVEVVGAEEKYVQLGSKARLQCTVSSTVQLPDYIFWYHRDHRLLDFHQPRLNISLARRGGQGSEMSVTSTLTITNARVADGGNYTCLPSNLHPATALLHVITDKHPEAMHTGTGRVAPPSLPAWVLLLLLLLMLLV